MKREAILVVMVMAGALAGCDYEIVRTADRVEHRKCFTIVKHELPPYPVLLDQCAGKTWLLTKMRLGEKPDDGFTYEWFALERLDNRNPSLVNR